MNKTSYYIEFKSFNVTFNTKSMKITNNKSLEVIKEYSFIIQNVNIYSGGYRQFPGYFNINFTNDTDFLYELYLTILTEGFMKKIKIKYTIIIIQSI